MLAMFVDSCIPHMVLNSVVGCHLIVSCMKYMRCTTFLSVCVQRNKKFHRLDVPGYYF